MTVNTWQEIIDYQEIKEAQRDLGQPETFSICPKCQAPNALIHATKESAAYPPGTLYCGACGQIIRNIKFSRISSQKVRIHGYSGWWQPLGGDQYRDQSGNRWTIENAVITQITEWEEN